MEVELDKAYKRLDEDATEQWTPSKMRRKDLIAKVSSWVVVNIPAGDNWPAHTMNILKEDNPKQQARIEATTENVKFLYGALFSEPPLLDEDAEQRRANQRTFTPEYPQFPNVRVTMQKGMKVLYVKGKKGVAGNKPTNRNLVSKSGRISKTVGHWVDLEGELKIAASLEEALAAQSKEPTSQARSAADPAPLESADADDDETDADDESDNGDAPAVDGSAYLGEID